MIITSDGEIDDLASFHRLLLHANDFAGSLIGIVYSSSHAHWAGDPDANPPIPETDWAGTHVFQEAIMGGEEYGTEGGYAAAYPNLVRHDPDFPTPEHLLSLVRIGNVSSHGEMAKDTDGSNLIRAALLDDDPRPLWLPVWGGTNTVAAALRSIEDEYRGTPRWEEIYERIVSKARIYIIFDQDPTYKNYIRRNWPDVQTTMNRDQFLSIAYTPFRTGNLPQPRTPLELDRYFSAAFTANLTSGPILADYPTNPDGTNIGEGDSPSFWNLLPVGLRSTEDPSYGGWGGRFDQLGPAIWTDWPEYVDDPAWYLPFDSTPPFRNWTAPSRTGDRNPYGDGRRSYELGYPQTRWIPALQNEFAARAQWQTASYADANHPPVVDVAGRLDRAVRPGQRITLVGRAGDPDGDRLTCSWWQYGEAGTFPGAVDIRKADTLNPTVVIPARARPGQTIHLILEVTDDGTFPMTRYQRVILTVADA